MDWLNPRSHTSRNRNFGKACCCGQKESRAGYDASWATNHCSTMPEPKIFKLCWAASSACLDMPHY